MIRFFAGLWGAKLCKVYFGLKGNKLNDRTGILARKIDGRFLEHISKPHTTIFITGTNGKTSITNVTSQMLRKAGAKLICNEWGANTLAGISWTLMEGVNIFNREGADTALIEVDELTCDESMPQVKPDFMLINNLSTDSMYNNANPGFIRNRLEKGASGSPGTTLILNADDPVSCFIGEDNKKVYFGVCDLHTADVDHIVDDFSVCPICGSIPEYKYRNYRHVGAFICPGCGLKTPERDYLVTGCSEGSITILEKDGIEFAYPFEFSGIHNIYNVAGIVALFRTLGYSREQIAEYLKGCKLPQTRSVHEKCGNIDMYKIATKGQNPPATSTVLESVVNAPGEKVLIMMLDETRDGKSIEPVNWIWDTDFELLRDKKIKRIIICGDRQRDHVLRLSCAGIDMSKVIALDNDKDIYENILTKGIDSIYLLHDVEGRSRFERVFAEMLDHVGKEVNA